MTTPEMCLCGGRSAVLETRAHVNWLRRRRRRTVCGAAWTTREMVEDREVRRRDPAIHFGASR